MKTALIYGLGRRFNNKYFLQFVLPEIEKRYEIKGISDKYKQVKPIDVEFGFIERSAKFSDYDCIIVTSDICYDEIKTELIEELSISEDKIVSLDDIIWQIVAEKIDTQIYRDLAGVEIGGPSKIFSPIYKSVLICDGVNFSLSTIWGKYSGDKYIYDERILGSLIISDAVDMSVIPSDKYEFLISSNNLEHIANPIKAINEFKRILVNNGIILIVVPRKEACFDHDRETTSFNHLIDDFKKDVSEHDLSHLDEIMNHHDFEMDEGVSSKEDFFRRAQNNYDNRCLHHHVYDEILLNDIFIYTGISVVKSGVLLNNFFIYGRVKKQGIS